MPQEKDILWNYFPAVEEGSNKEFKCLFCEKKYLAGNASNKRKHLLKCTFVPDNVKNKIIKCVENKRQTQSLLPFINVNVTKKASTVSVVNNNTENEDAEIVDLESEASDLPSSGPPAPAQAFSLPKPSSSTGVQVQRQQKTGFVITRDVITKEKQDELRTDFSRAVILSGCPLGLFDQEVWQLFFKKLRPAFQKPSRKTIASLHLDREYEQTMADVEKQLNEAFTVNIQCDGWTNIMQEHIINFIGTLPKPIFLKSINCGPNRQTSEYIMLEVKKVIFEIGVDKVFSLMGDNAANLQKAYQNIALEFPHIIVLSCLAHTLNLLFGFIISKTPVLRILIDDVLAIVSLIRNSTILKGIFEDIKKNNNFKGRLVSPVKTRWGSALFTQESVLKCKKYLKELAIDDRARDGFAKKVDYKHLLVKDYFWDCTEEAIKLLKPIVRVITQLEGDDPGCAAAVPILEKMSTEMVNLVQNTTLKITEQEKERIYSEIGKRKNQFLKPVYYAAHILDPRYMGSKLNPNQFSEGVNFIVKVAKDMKDVDEKKALQEYVTYKNKLGIWSAEHLWNNPKIKPRYWWNAFGEKTEIKKVALRILSAPVSSATTERSFSCFGNTQNRKRNRLETERAAKITSIIMNSRFSKKSKKKCEKEDEINDENWLEEDFDEENAIESVNDFGIDTITAEYDELMENDYSLNYEQHYLEEFISNGILSQENF